MKFSRLLAILAVLVVTNLFSYLNGRIVGFLMGREDLAACMVPLEHAIVRLKIEKGEAIQVNKVTKPMGDIAK